MMQASEDTTSPKVEDKKKSGVALLSKDPPSSDDLIKAGDLELKSYEENVHKAANLRFGKGFFEININPITFFASLILIGGFIIWCCVEQEKANTQLSEGKKWIADTFTWIYILSQNLWLIFLIGLLFTPYANIKLGRPDDKPDFSTMTWFVMLFAAGIGIGLFFFGVAEPIQHYEPCYSDPFAATKQCFGNRFSLESDNPRANFALMLTYFHWGLHGWIVYVIMAILLGFMTYRKGLPLTMKSTFYPLIGDKIFGWLGDVIDIISVVTTMFGVCTSLGLGVMQISEGLSRLNSGIKVNTGNQIIIIWCITAVATGSVISGMKMGIRFLSQLTFGLGMFILTLIFFADKSFYLLDVFTQTVGIYIQWLPKLSFHTDAFNNVDSTPDGTGTDQLWMDGWTIFYWGWWIAWAPFVGTFIAKISKGRTIKQLIIGALTAPTLYSILWMSVFGGAGIRMEREAAIAGLDCATDATTRAVVSGSLITRLSCRSSTQMLFDLLDRYNGIAKFLFVVAMVSIILYFVTSSDSGSLVIDCLTANGNPHPPVLQRVFWAAMEGACATSLLVAGGDDSLRALQTVAIAAGLPLTFVLCFMCQSLWIALKEENGDLPLDSPQFKTDLFDPIAMPGFTVGKLSRSALAIFCPIYEISLAAKLAWGWNVGLSWLLFGVSFYAWPLLLLLTLAQDGLWIVGWTMLLVFATLFGTLRGAVREASGIRGDVITDFLVTLVLYPMAAVQVYDEAAAHGGAVAVEASGSKDTV